MANKSIKRIEGILQFYTTALGRDYNAYRNHVYRVYHLTLLLSKEDIGLEGQEQLAIAAAFHDLGVWTHRSMDYLDPSVGLAMKYLDENAMHDQSTIQRIIENHHKLKSYHGTDQNLVESFRKADLIDLSMGKIKLGLPANFYQNLKEEFPFLGFHQTIYGKVLRHAITRFWNPFPMIRI